MHNPDRSAGARDHILGWMGAVLLIGIIPIKLVRFEHHAAASFAIGVAPSVLGPAGLLFLLLSGTRWVSRFSLLQVTLLVALFSVTLEFMQLLPRPGVLAYAHYTFDYYDLLATVLSIVMAYAIAAVILREPRPVDGE